MSSFVSIGAAAQGRGIPMSAAGSWAPQQRWAPDQRNPRQQRCSHRACRRIALYQSAPRANRKIAARVGPTTARMIWRGNGSTPMAPSRDGAISVRRLKGINPACRRCRIVRGRVQGSVAIAWCGTGGGILGSKEVEVVLRNRGAFRTDLPAEAILFSKWLHGLRGVVDPDQTGCRSG
jgi:hypothetical protein